MSKRKAYDSSSQRTFKCNEIERSAHDIIDAIQSLREEIKKAENKIELQKNSILRLSDKVDKNRSIIDGLETVVSTLQTENSDLKYKLRQQNINEPSDSYLKDLKIAEMEKRIREMQQKEK